MAAPGDYLLSTTIDGTTHRQVLRVERKTEIGPNGLPEEVEAMLKAFERWERSR